MKKSRILVPALAVLALGIAGSSVGTVAWFVANQAATISEAAAEEKTVVSENSTLDAGSFTISTKAVNPSTSIGLTDTDGKTFVYVGSVGSSNLVEASTEHPYGAASCGLVVQYNNPDDAEEKSGAEIKAIWLDTIKNNNITIHVEQKASESHAMRFLDAQPGSYTGASSQDFVILNSTLIGLAFNDTDASSDGGKATTEPSVNLWICLTGDNTEQKASDVYTAVYSCSVTAPAQA